ncbi:CHAT domain-containing protein [Crepidotus variabilis]|uniref:CHAT domain-containing protein n=1 Tax=Crepidotus variabilis TaxID=179855 RepID=A0A9P6EKX6_9AGAR|nr:CHAT domain-containing protein [Crepidotus variabilis]
MFAISLANQEQGRQHFSAPLSYFNAGTTSLERFQETKSTADLSDGIENVRLAISLTPEDHQNMPEYLNLLGTSLLARFECTEDLTDISAAIEHFQKSVRLTPEGHPHMPSILDNLGAAFSGLFERTDDLADISAAIEHRQKSVSLAPEGHPDLPMWLTSLGNSFLRRFKRTGDLDDLSSAIKHHQNLVELTPTGHPNLPTELNNLGNSLLTRFKQTGDLDDISAAIGHLQKSVELTPEGDLGMPTRLNSLGNSFLRRFERTGDIDELSVAIEHHKKALKLTPEGHPSMPALLTSLGNSFFRRFERTGELDNISIAIEHYQKALELTLEGHPDMPMRLNNLGNSLMRRFKKTSELADLSTAIEHYQRSVELTPKGDPAMTSRLNNLGNSFTIRSEQTGDLPDMIAAIDYHQKAVNLTPEGHADMPRRRSSLGNVLMIHFKQTKNIRACQVAALNYRLAATQNMGKPTVQLQAAGHWAILALMLGDYAECLSAFGAALELLPLVASLDQTVQNRHTSLLGISDLTGRAITVALILESTDKALEWFEQGRCLIWTQLNQLRTPVDHLRRHDAPIAERFLAVAQALEASGSRPQSAWIENSTITQQIAVEDEVRSQLKLAREFEQLLIKIRDLPDFNDFLRPPKAANIISRLPTDGPVVVVNVQSASCNALALIHGAEEPIRIPLDNFTYEKARLLQNQLGYHLTSERVRMRDSDDRAGRVARRPDTGLRHILRELWNGVVWPILQGLGYSSPPVHRNRIWWCLTGPLAFMPIHAAGIYDSDPKAKVPGRCLSDFAVSSYIPTVTTLLEKLKNDVNLKRQNTKVLLLSQPNALPDFPIPGTTTETWGVYKQMQATDIDAVLLEEGEGTKDRVTAEMGTHGWIHIASHASQHPTEPLKSGFYLRDGQLELLEIIRQNLPSAEFAFLSACQTSVGDEKLSEEVVHLAAGMLAAGYQGVTATMWSIKDQYAPKIAEDFYEFLLREKRESGAHRLDSRRAAYALDHATRKIRERLGDSESALLTWVPYIHLGL